MSDKNLENVADRRTRFVAYAAVGAAIVIFIAVGYWVFDMPLWATIMITLVAFFINGLITLIEKH